MGKIYDNIFSLEFSEETKIFYVKLKFFVSGNANLVKSFFYDSVFLCRNWPKNFPKTVISDA